MSMSGQITNQYIIGEERSFTIIAYPVPEIGEKFEEIFAETVKINTLDYTLYQNMQQKIIDVLDQAEKVHITGKITIRQIYMFLSGRSKILQKNLHLKTVWQMSISR